MGMKKTLLLIAIVFFVVACHDKEDACVTSVGPEEALMVTDTITMKCVRSDLQILMPVRLFITKNHLVLYQTQVEKLFQIYDLPLTGKCFSVGMIGRGPDEFISPDSRSMIGNQSGICLADKDAYKSVSIVDSTLKVESKEPLFTDGAPLNGVIKIGDKYLNLDVNAMIPGQMPEGIKQFQVIGTEGVENRICDLPDWDENNSNIVRYVSHVVANPENDLFAAFYCGYRKIRYYSMSGNLIKEVSADFPDQSVHTGSLFYETYTSLVASKDRIAVRCGNYARTGQDITPDSTEYQIWDWDGHLIHRLIVPMRLGAYTVDFSTGILYATSSEFEDEIFYSDISEYLK